MKNKKIIFGLFVLLACIQLYAVASMIMKTESILQKGESIKLRLLPIDPTDPFRGKYVILSYQDTRLNTDSLFYWDDNQKEIYVSFRKDSLGFSKPDKFFVEPPENTTYLKVNARRSWSWEKNNNLIYITYPQDRFYMEESKAKPAEDLVRKALNEQKACYVELKVHEGKSAIENVYIGDIPLSQALENN